MFNECCWWCYVDDFCIVWIVDCFVVMDDEDVVFVNFECWIVDVGVIVFWVIEDDCVCFENIFCVGFV